jgi:DNA-binding GntR family transcriptional regulator
MRVPIYPLGDLDDYSLSTLQELADQHLDRANELRRKLDGVVERHEALVKAIEKKDGPEVSMSP